MAQNQELRLADGYAVHCVSRKKKMRLSLEMLLLAKVARWLGAVPHLRLAAAVGLWQLFESAGSRAAVSRERSAREPRSNESRALLPRVHEGNNNNTSSTKVLKGSSTHRRRPTARTRLLDRLLNSLQGAGSTSALHSPLHYQYY